MRSKEEEKWYNTEIEDPDCQICELLLCACSRGSLVDFKRLLQDDVSLLDRRDRNNYSPMSVFCLANFPKFVSAILDVVGPCTLDRELFVGPLFVSIAMGHNSIVDKLVEYGAAPNKFFPSFCPTAFQCAAQYGNLYCAKIFAPPVEKLPDRLTELIGGLEGAFFYDRKSIAAWALPHYRQILTTHTCIVDRIIHAIVRGGAVSIASWLMEDETILWFCFRSRLVRLYPGTTAILECCTRGNAEFLAWILQTFRREAIEKCGDFDTSLLWLCLELNKLECLRALAENVRDVHISSVKRMRNGVSESLLLWSCMKGNLDHIRCLIQLGCNVNETVDDIGEKYIGMPLCVKMAQVGSLDVLKVLLSDGNCDLRRYTCKEKENRMERDENEETSHRAFSRLFGPVKGSCLYSALYFRHITLARWLYSQLSVSERQLLATPEMVFLCYLRDSELFQLVASDQRQAIPNGYGCTILDVALKNGDTTSASRLLSSDPQLHYSDFAILKVVEDGIDCIEVLDWCTQNGKPIFEVSRALIHDACTSSSINLFGTACLHGRSEVLRYLIDIWDGPKVNLVDSKFFGIAPVSWACIGGHLEVVQLLAQYGASLNVVDVYENTLLHLAAARGKSLELVEYLLRVEPAIPLEHTNYVGRSVLLECVARSSCDSIELHKCERLTGKQNPAFETCVRNLSQKHICQKAWSCICLVEKLVEAGASIWATDKGGNNLVATAALSGDVLVLKYCLQQGLSFSFTSPNPLGPPEGPVWIAAMYGRCAAVEFIVDVAMPTSLGVSASEFESSSANVVTMLRMGMHCADPIRRLEFLKHMLFNRRYTELKQLGPHLLMECCATPDRNQCMDLFLSETSVSLDWTNSVILEKTIGVACENGDKEMVKTLVKAGCPLKSTFGEKLINPLICACVSGSKPLVRWLIGQGCNPFDSDSDGRNAFDYAMESGDSLESWLGL